MTLTYRGQAYTTSNQAAAVKPQIFTYRSQSYQRSAAVAVPTQTQLVYRGVPYQASQLASDLGFEHHQVALSCPLCA